MDEAIKLANPVEADTSTTQNAADRILSLMDGKPSEELVEEPVVAEEVTEEVTEEPTEEDVAHPVEDAVTHFSDLAEHLGVEESYLENLLVPTKINGEEREATIKDLVATFQKGGSADLKLMELADNRKQFDMERSQYTEALQQEWSRIQTLNTELQNMLTGDEESQLQQMRHSDPAEYAARMADRQSRLQRAHKINDEMQQTQNKKVLDDYSRKVSIEGNRLIDAIPEWSDDKTRTAENRDVRQYLLKMGMQDFEIDGKFENGRLVHPGVIDHRAIVLARKAMLFDQARSGTEPKKAKLKSLPKMGAGRPKSKADVNDAKRKEIRGQVRKSGSIDDAAMVIRQLMES